MKKAVYTVITGDHMNYHLKEPTVNNPDWDHIFFNNGDIEMSDDSMWKSVILEKSSLSPLKQSRLVKIMYQSFITFDHYDIILYLDSRFTITKNLNSYFDEFINSDKILGVMKHNKRSSLYDEAGFLSRVDDKLFSTLHKQACDYSADEMPNNYGLWAPGIMIRKNCDIVNKLMIRWWVEVSKYTHRDIVSLPYAMWCEKFDKNKWLHEMDFNKTYNDFMDR